MKKQLFTEHVKSRGATIIPTDDPNFDKHMLLDFKSSKDFIKHIDFNCQISKAGGCKQYPELVKCCCGTCMDNAGYFRVMVDSDLTKYARMFSVKTGFWRQDKGCILPHSLRSTTCLTAHCNRGKHDRGFNNVMEAIKERIIHFRERI